MCTARLSIGQTWTLVDPNSPEEGLDDPQHEELSPP